MQMTNFIVFFYYSFSLSYSFGSIVAVKFKQLSQLLQFLNSLERLLQSCQLCFLFLQHFRLRPWSLLKLINALQF